MNDKESRRQGKDVATNMPTGTTLSDKAKRRGLVQVTDAGPPRKSPKYYRRHPDEKPPVPTEIK